MKPLGKTYKDAEASGGDFERLPAGGYVCRILDVKDDTAKECLVAVFDIAEGDKKGFYSDEWGKKYPTAHCLWMSYKETALGMLKGRLKAIDESNGTEFEKDAVTGLNEQQLVGKLVGLIIGYEEYKTNRGDIRERTYVKTVCGVDKIRRGDFRVPELKKLKEQAPKEDPMAGFTLADSDIPF